MSTTKTGSGIVRVGYADPETGIILCKGCAAITDPNTLRGWDAVYSPDVNDDFSPCFACGVSLDR